MKLRHAAALALVGWYLMGPPVGSRYGTVPLSQWEVLDSFDRVDDCKKVRDKNLNSGIETLKKFHLDSPNELDQFLDSNDLFTYVNAIAALSALQMECIGTDDPRLK